MTQPEPARRQRRWRVFLSSARDDVLDGYRRAAADVVAGFPELELVAMEGWGSRDWPARQYCVNEVLLCDLLVGIVGGRYGSPPPDDQRSYTEIEYDTACTWDLGRLLYLVADVPPTSREPATAGAAQESDAQVAALQRLRDRMRTDSIVRSIGSTDAFRAWLRGDLAHWIRSDSVPRRLVDRREEYPLLRQRLLDPEPRGPVTIVCGLPGVGKSELIRTLLDDRLVKEHFRRSGGATIGQWEGTAGPQQEFSGCCDALGVPTTGIDFERDRGPGVLDRLWSRLLATLTSSSERAVLSLAFQTGDGHALDPHDGRLRELLPHLARTDQGVVAMLLECSDRELAWSLRNALDLDARDVMYLSDLPTTADGYRLMARIAPSVRACPEEALALVDDLGGNPFYLRAAARQVDELAGPHPSDRAIREALRERRTAVVAGDIEEKHERLLVSYLGRLDGRALEFLRRLTVLRSKPLWFDAGLAAVLARPLRAPASGRGDQAVAEGRGGAGAAQDDPSEEETESAHGVLNRLARAGMLESAKHELPDGAVTYPADMGEKRTEPWVLHPNVIAAVTGAAPLGAEAARELHIRSEAYFRRRISALQGQSYASWYRMERPRWRHDVTGWLHHLGHLEPLSMLEAFALLFLDAWWWWDLYVEFEASEHLLQAAVALATRPDLPGSVRSALHLLAELRRNYPRQHDLAMVSVRHRAGAGADLDEEGRREMRDLLEDRPALLLQALGGFRDHVREAAESRATRAHALSDTDRGHLEGVISLLEAHAHRLVAQAATLGRAQGASERERLALAAGCYRHGLAEFDRAGDAWDCAWTRYELAEILWRIGPRREATTLWHRAARGAADERDRELLANLERSRADDYWGRGGQAESLEHYGRALFYALAFHLYDPEKVEVAPWAGNPDHYTRHFYDEVRLQCALPLLEARGEPAEMGRRLDLLFGSWGGAWTVPAAAPCAGLASVDEIADTFFPHGPGASEIGPASDDGPETEWHRRTRELLSRVATQRWVVGIPRPGRPAGA